MVTGHFEPRSQRNDLKELTEENIGMLKRHPSVKNYPPPTTTTTHTFSLLPVIFLFQGFFPVKVTTGGINYF